MKVETTGEFMLVDIHGGQTISHDGVSDVKDTPFVQTCLADGRLKLAEKGKAKTEEKANTGAPTSGKQAKTEDKAE